ncbi:MAG: hypothetical protein LBV54_07230 [Puniceicoccales bacterium]|jgi:hypothetical protein|nr:hypothetical protein [Puniceicoccales bacterium]
MRAPLLKSRRVGTLLAVLLACSAIAFFPATGSAAEPTHKAQISERTAAKLEPLKKLLDANDYPNLLVLLDEILATAEPDSFDRALFSQIRGQVLLNLKRYTDAIAPLETARRLGETYSYLDTETIRNILHLLSQLYYQEAFDTKDLGARHNYYVLAYERIQRWIQLTPRVSADIYLYAATLLYGDATIVPDKPDPAKLRVALTAAEQSLLARNRPDDQTLLLYVSIHQLLGQHVESVGILEFLVERDPANATYWQQIFATYSTLASVATTPRDIRKWQLRMLSTLSRAQARGLLTSSQDFYNNVALLFTLHQFERAALLLEQGLADGRIASTRQNWELLASSWQQQHEDERAIASLDKAVKANPKDGELELSLARLHHSGGKADTAYTHARHAVEASGVENPGAAKFYLACLAYELQKFAEASRWADSAAGQPGVKKDEFERLKAAIRDALAEEKNRAPAPSA